MSELTERRKRTCSRCARAEHFKDVEFLKHTDIYLGKPTTTTIILCKKCWQTFYYWLRHPTKNLIELDDLEAEGER